MSTKKQTPPHPKTDAHHRRGLQEGKGPSFENVMDDLHKPSAYHAFLKPKNSN